MNTIHKYQLDVDDFTNLSLPKGATLLHVGTQHGWVTLWFELNPDDEHVDRTFHLVGTGHKVPPAGKYCGTAIVDPFVWHVYEVPYEAPTS